MNRIEITAYKSNEMDYYFEKCPISRYEKKGLVFRGSLQYFIMITFMSIV